MGVIYLFLDEDSSVELTIPEGWFFTGVAASGFEFFYPGGSFSILPGPGKGFNPIISLSCLNPVGLEEPLPSTTVYGENPEETFQRAVNEAARLVANAYRQAAARLEDFLRNG